MVLENQGVYSQTLATGLLLASLPLCEGGWAEYFDEDQGLGIEDEYLRASTAIMLENEKQWLAPLFGRPRMDSQGRQVINEETISPMVGGFSDFLFPIVRASFPTNPINDLVSVQVTSKPHATIIYWDFIYGTNKGTYFQGQKLADANRGRLDGGHTYTSELIDAEVATTGSDGSAVALTLRYSSGGGVRPGTVMLTIPTSDIGDIQVFDDGNGAFLGATGTVNYVTGAIAISAIDTGTLAAGAVTAQYRWNSEGSPDTPEIEVQVTTTTAETERRVLRARYTTEAAQNVRSELGIDLESELVMASANEINYEIARQIIHELWAAAPVVATYPIRPAAGAGFNQQDHFRDIVTPVNETSNHIANTTQKGYGNWILVDDAAATIVESLPSTLFEAAPRPANVQGIHYIGRLMGRYAVYKDIFLGQEPGASAYGNLLMGFRGTSFYEAGYVWAPYRLLYTTDTITLSDFVSQKGLASRYARKMVNPHMYARITLTPGG